MVGWGSFVLKEKLKSLKGEIKEWKKDAIGEVRKGIIKALEEINRIDELDESDGVGEAEISKRKELMAGFWKLSNYNESILWQRSRCKWVMEGDRNTKYFHACINKRHLRNHLSGVKIGVEWVEDPIRVKEGVAGFFENRYKESCRDRPTLDGVQFRSLREDDKVLLDKKFDLEEIREAVWDCEGNKSPGPDGFNFTFIKRFWDLLKDDIWRVLNEFYENGRLSKGVNSSFIALIPKVESPLGLNDFRPISLVGCIYKIIAKVLAARLRNVMHYLIEENQSAFVGGRLLLDGVVVANEVVDDAKKRKKNLLLV